MDIETYLTTNQAQSPVCMNIPMLINFKDAIIFDCIKRVHSKHNSNWHDLIVWFYYFPLIQIPCYFVPRNLTKGSKFKYFYTWYLETSTKQMNFFSTLNSSLTWRRCSASRVRARGRGRRPGKSPGSGRSRPRGVWSPHPPPTARWSGRCTFWGKVFPLEVGDTFASLRARAGDEEHRCPRCLHGRGRGQPSQCGAAPWSGCAAHPWSLRTCCYRWLRLETGCWLRLRRCSALAPEVQLLWSPQHKQWIKVIKCRTGNNRDTKHYP